MPPPWSVFGQPGCVCKFWRIYFCVPVLLHDDGNCPSGSRGHPRSRDGSGPCDPTLGKPLLSSYNPPSKPPTEANVAVIFRSSDESLTVSFFRGSSPLRLRNGPPAHLESARPNSSVLPLCAHHQSTLLSTFLSPRALLPPGPFNVVLVFSSSLSRRGRRQRSRGRSGRL